MRADPVFVPEVFEPTQTAKRAAEWVRLERQAGDREAPNRVTRERSEDRRRRPQLNPKSPGGEMRWSEDHEIRARARRDAPRIPQGLVVPAVPRPRWTGGRVA